MRIILSQKIGAVIPIEQYDLIENALKTPLHIYEDTAQKELVYVFTHPFEQSKLVKVVVHPNYRLNGKTIINAAKSWGFVSIESLENPQFVLIKIRERLKSLSLNWRSELNRQ